MDRTQCWCHRCQRRWREPCTSCHGSECTRLMYFTTALKVFTKWGTGAGEFVRAMRSVSVVPQDRTPMPKDQTLRHRHFFSPNHCASVARLLKRKSYRFTSGRHEGLLSRMG